ncbi:type VII secretion target [Glycomyces harbinensis]|uniref:Excreted virulence factor EspC, type VII ESX diderm n=1 Tax=Glycomyces harbinensis TaxID=58114 RepID=A0A1G6Y7I3_9ACTN|nr:type VII secretion target [Glycomyces harbinensis]SDD85546.1 Excreted virulence factor EspC, type VII ESX diderm [Glycomyces harbinensis]
MAGSIEVITDDLRAHAANIESVRERFAAVLSAIDSVSQDNEAYGIICQFLPPILAGRQEDQKELTTMAQENLELLAQALRATADDYESADETAAQEHRGIEDQL